MARLASRISNLPIKTVWTEFTPLAQKHGAVNLGQGFPDFGLEQFVQKAGTACVGDKHPLANQYTRSMGNLDLVNALSKTFSPLFSRELDPLQNIVVTTGATGALYNAFSILLNPGDECLIIEPFFDVYPGDIEMAGAKPVFVPLHPGGSTANDWKVDAKELEDAITERTRAIVINTPQNIPGKTWSREELEMVADLAKKHDLVVIADEVYERMLFDGAEHIRMATLPGMFERTITIGSAGKTFSATGWKIGWAITTPQLAQAMAQVQAHLVFSVTTPMQTAVARALEESMGTEYYQELNEMFRRKRARLTQILTQGGLSVIPSQGAYFLVADISKVPYDLYKHEAAEGNVGRDWAFCRWLTKEIGVTAIPCTAFYSMEHRHLGENFVRFAFCKDDKAYDEAEPRLLKLKELLVGG